MRHLRLSGYKATVFDRPPADTFTGGSETVQLRALFKTVLLEAGLSGASEYAQITGGPNRLRMFGLWEIVS